MATEGVLPWLKRNLFGGWRQHARPRSSCWRCSCATLPPLLRLGGAATRCARPDNAACRALGHAGACWGVIAEKYRLILFGRYPYEEQWRPLVGDGA